MTIPCRTGCGQQIFYEEYEFPDGFVYFLPNELDTGTIHNCSKLPENPFLCTVYDDAWPNSPRLKELITERENFSPSRKKNLNNYELDYLSLENNIHDEEFELMIEDDIEEIKKLENSYLRKKLMNLQLKSVLFPAPYMENMEEGITDNPEINKDGVYASDLINLALIYEVLGNYKCAEKCRLIQDKISNDQAEKIAQLYERFEKNKVDEVVITTNFSAIKLRDVYYRKVENSIKSFLRKYYVDGKKLQIDHPREYENAEKKKLTSSENIIRDHDDVIEYLTFGESVRILKSNNVEKEKKDWIRLRPWVIDYAFLIFKGRNDMDHYSDESLEKAIPKEIIASGFFYSKKIIDELTPKI